MPMYGTCPKCEQVVNSLNLSTITASVQGGKTFHAATFLCPHCQTILGASFDPVAAATDAASRATSAVQEIGSQFAKRFDEVVEYLKPRQNRP